MNGRDTDESGGKLHFEDACIDMAEPLRLVGVTLEIEPRHERLVAADDHHHQQVRDHHHVDQPQHHQHDLLLGKIEGVRDEVPQLLQKQHGIDALGDDQADIERQLQPARREDQQRQRAQGGDRRLRGERGFRRQGHGGLSSWRGNVLPDALCRNRDDRLRQNATRDDAQHTAIPASGARRSYECQFFYERRALTSVKDPPASLRTRSDDVEL